MKIGFLGPRGTFSFEAAKSYSNENDELVMYRTIKECIEAVDNSRVDKVVIPIENSLQGTVTETVDSLVESKGVFIESEIIIKISQNLMANNKYHFEEIKEVYSHPQAIAQCRNYIDKNFRNADIIEVSSTALAAKEIKNKNNCACIANMSCVEEYGLTLLEENIQDNEFNQTKFWVLGREVQRKGTKMSLIFSTKHKPGALYNVLGLFNENNINLLKIESRPAKTFLGEYIFLVDVEISQRIGDTIDVLRRECSYLKVLGRY